MVVVILSVLQVALKSLGEHLHRKHSHDPGRALTLPTRPCDGSRHNNIGASVSSSHDASGTNPATDASLNSCRVNAVDSEATQYIEMKTSTLQSNHDRVGTRCVSTTSVIVPVTRRYVASVLSKYSKAMRDITHIYVAYTVLFCTRD